MSTLASPPQRAFSLRQRLLGATVALIVLALLTTSLVLVDLFQDHTQKQLDQQLQIYLNQLIANLEFSDSTPPITLKQELSDPRFTQPYSGLYWQVSDQQGQVLLRSRSLWDTHLEQGTRTVTIGEHTSYTTIVGPNETELRDIERRIYDEAHPDRLFYVHVAVDTQAMKESLSSFSGILFFSMGLLGLGLLIASWMHIQLSLKPLSQIRHRLSSIQAGETRHLEGDYPSEIQPLVNKFNEVLAHDNEVLLRARTQAGNLAHALKTPLTILSHAAQNQQTPLSLLVTEQVNEAKKQINYHLAQTRAAACANIPGMKTSVATTLNSLLRVMSKLHHEKKISHTVEGLSASIFFKGEEQDLQEMLGNLIDNAYKWAKTSIHIRISQPDTQRIVIDIHDDGPGLAPSDRLVVLQRGQRADEHVSGSGIGLAIVFELAQLYGGELELGQSPLGGLHAKLGLSSYR